jgi:peptidyl-prolyl cis-trans isomerase SurA
MKHLSFATARVAAAAALSCVLLLGAAAPAAAQQPRVALRNGDYIAVIVNQELVTAGEVDRRVERTQAEAPRGTRMPPEPELRRQVLDALIDERVMITSAREMGMRVEDADVERAIQSIAAQNQITLPVLRQRLAAEGTDYARFRANIRDQITIERLREREVYRRIQVADEDIDKWLAEQRSAAAADAETNLAQILVTVSDGASDAVVAERRARAEAALARVSKGEDFATVAREVSEDGNRANGGVIGLRPASRLPDLFVEATRNVKPGEVAPALLRSGAGFHVLKVVERKEPGVGRVVQTRVRHVLLRTSPQLTAEVATRRLAEYRQQIERGAKFEDIARQHSEDGSAAQGGDLGWTQPGVMVPEFESAMNGLAVGALSAPVVSRFGVHLIQVQERRDMAIEPKQLREQARNVLREQRFENAYLDWTKELRSRAYVEYREPPQ